jgi:hypothetical protein
MGYYEDDYGPDPREFEFPDDEDLLIDGVGFANEGSALRAETDDNPRIFPCPTCGGENRLTQIDVDRGYQCDPCADRAEGGFGGSLSEY